MQVLRQSLRKVFGAINPLVCGLPRRRVVVVRTRHGEKLHEVFCDDGTWELNPQLRPPIWCVLFWFHRVFMTRAVPRQSRTLVSVAKVVGARRIVATDVFSEEFLGAEAFLPRARLYWVQHGLYLNQTESEIKREADYPIRNTSIKLLAISPYDCENYLRWGVRPSTSVAVGSLKNGLYVNQQISRTQGLGDKFDICLVEKGFALEPPNEFFSEVRAYWNRFLLIFAETIQIMKPNLVIAFSKTDNTKRVIEHFQNTLNYPFDFTDPEDPFATYRASDSASITIGVVSTVLAESLSRQRKVLSFNCSHHDIWNLPGSASTRVSDNPNFSAELLRNKLTETIAQSWGEYAAKNAETIRLLTVDPSATLQLIRNEVLSGMASKNDNAV